MSNLYFGADIRIENLMLLEAISAEDAEIICDEFEELEEIFAKAGISIPIDELYDNYELREFFEGSGITGVFGFACTPVPQMSECGKHIKDLSWNYYARLPVYGKDISEFKEKAVEEVAAYRKKKIDNQGGEV